MADAERRLIELHRAMQRVTRDFYERPTQVRLTPERWERMVDEMRPVIQPSMPWEGSSIPGLMGMAVILADDLRPNQWRLCRSDGSMAYDSLSGKTLREVLKS